MWIYSDMRTCMARTYSQINLCCLLKKRCWVLILKILHYFGFYAFGFEAIPHPSCYLISIVDKTHYGPVIALFSVHGVCLARLKVF